MEKYHGNMLNDTANQFILSGMEIIKANHLIIYSPIKYWKIYNLIDSKWIQNSALLNREKFHASKSTIALISFAPNVNFSTRIHKQPETLIVDVHDTTKYTKHIKQATRDHRELIDKIPKNTKEDLIIIGNCSWDPDFKNCVCTDKSGDYRCKDRWYDQDTMLLAIPLYLSNFIERDDWTDYGTIAKYVGNDTYQNDKEFLNDCLTYLLLTHKHSISKNCKIWDIYQKEIQKDLNVQNILKLAKIDKWIGLKNIDTLYNTQSDDKFGNKQYDNPQLNNAIKEFKTFLKKYFKEKIESKLFEYELLK